MTNYGFCLFNTYQRSIIAKVSFTKAYSSIDFMLSPKVKILAIVGSSWGEKDLIDGEYRFNNSITLYDLETGSVLGEQSLDTDLNTSWKIDFSEDGRQLKVSSEMSTFVFKLITTQTQNK